MSVADRRWTSGSSVPSRRIDRARANRERVVVEDFHVLQQAYLAPITSRTAEMISGGNENALA